MKVAGALKMALPTLAEKKIMMEKIAAALQIPAQNVPTTPPIAVPETPERNVVRRAPFVTPRKPIQFPVCFDRNAFFTALEDGETPIPGSTASTHKCRARNDVNGALNGHGKLEHQAAIIHDICTEGPKAGIGVALGILENPEKHCSVTEHLFQDTFEILHCDRVFGKNTKQAIEFTNNTLLATAPTAPAEGATPEEKRAYHQKFNKYCDEMQLTAGMRKKAANSGVRRREILYADDTEEKLTYFWKRKPPSDMKLTPGNIEAVQEWLFTESKLVDPSPNKRDEITVKDEATGEKVKHRKHHYKFSIRELYNEFKKPVERGGFDGMENTQALSFH
jgi:hypothetical protein